MTLNIIAAMESRIDYSQHSEAELVEMFGRLDPRYAPEECARLGKYLTERGYRVTQGDTEPGFAEPSAAKLQELIGSPRPFETTVEFGGSLKLGSLGLMSSTDPANNSLRLTGAGKLRYDGIYVYLSDRMSSGVVRLSSRYIVNAESKGRSVRFEYRTDVGVPGTIRLLLPDDAVGAALVAHLPATNTPDFRPQIEANEQFAGQLRVRSSRTPVTFGLVAVNSLVFIGMLFDGADLLQPTTRVSLAWGSNFGPYTTDGDWWRVFTSLFIHFGFVHIFANMWALAAFGPLVERLYGSTRYLLIYLLAGVFGSLCSISAHPLVNSAGASGAIFGVLGALLATLTRGRNHIPPDVLRPVLRTTLAFIGWSVYSSLTNPGIDYVAHMGGFAAGFILGWLAMPTSGSEKKTLRRSVLNALSAASAAAILLIGGIWWAQSSVTSVIGEALYYRTVHWITLREPGIDAIFKAALRADDRKSHAALREILETKVIPFWQNASDRLAAVQLPKHSANVAKLDAIQDISDRRAQAFQLLDDGLRDNDPRVIATAGRELREIK